MPKLVASTTLHEPLEWNARLIEGDIAEAVAKLKRDDGGEILMYGSPTLMRNLKRQGRPYSRRSVTREKTGLGPCGRPTLTFHRLGLVSL